MQDLEGELAIYAGRPAPDSAIRLMNYEAAGVVARRNVFVANGRVFLQNSPILRLLRARVSVMDLNPRVSLAWPVLIARRLLGKPTVLWGHATPRSGATGARNARWAMCRLADVLVAYTESQAALLREAHPDRLVFAAPNSLYFRDEIDHAASSRGRDPRSVIYVGRLVAEKKPLLLLDAFERAAASVDWLLLDIVGDGPQMSELAERASESAFASRITIHGHVDEFDHLARLYGRSIVAVSPGYVGLSATQSLAMGVPLLVSRDEPHAPESDALREGFNCRFFDTDKVDDLAAHLVAFANERNAWSARAPQLSQDIAENYSVESMAAGIVAAIRWASAA